VLCRFTLPRTWDSRRGMSVDSRQSLELLSKLSCTSVHRRLILLVLRPKSDELRDRPSSIGGDRHLVPLWSRSGLSDYCHFEGAGKLRCLYMTASKSTNKAFHPSTTRIRGGEPDRPTTPDEGRAGPKTGRQLPVRAFQPRGRSDSLGPLGRPRRQSAA
jgi:hypothetical protein